MEAGWFWNELVQGSTSHSPFDVFLAPFLQVLIFLANLSGGLVIGVATLRGLVRFIGSLLGRSAATQEAIRLSLGRSLVLALEFQLAADILATALNPSVRDIAVLAAIVTLRTVLNFFLNREIEQASRLPVNAMETPTAT